MECRDPEVQQVCFTNAAGVRSTLFAVIVFAANGAPHATYYADAAGVVVDTSGGTVDVGACVQDCDEVFIREPWHSTSLVGEPVAVAFTTSNSVLPEAAANAINGTVNPANPSGLNRFFAASLYDSALAGGGNWTEPGVSGSAASNPAGWYGYVGPVTNTNPALWPYSALTLQVSPDPGCAPPPTVDVSMSFQWRYDGPHLPPLAAPAQVGDLGVIAWLIDVTGPTVVAQVTVTELTVTTLGQTGVVTLAAPGLTVAQANNLAVVIAVNTAEGGATTGDVTLPSGSTFLKNTGWTISKLSLDVTGIASCPQCITVFREVTCDDVRWRDSNGNIVSTPANAKYGGCSPVSTQIGEVCYTDAAGVSSTLFATVTHDVDGVKLATIYTNAAGDPVDTTGGSVAVGACDCPKVVVEQACVRTNTAGAPLPGTFDTLTVDTLTFTHLHWIYNSTNNLGYPGGIPIPGPNPSPIDMTSVAAVQAVLDAAFGAGQVGYTFIAPSTGIFYALNATIAATQPNFAWIGDINDYTDKQSFNAFDPVPGPGVIESRAVEVVKTIGCDGTISVVLYEQDGTPIAPQPAAGTWTLGDCKRIVETRDVCIDIAGVPTEVWQVIVRDAVTGAIVSSSFEDASGVAVTGTIVECSCEPPAVVPNYPLIERGAYGRAAWVPGKWDAPFVTDCGPYSWAAEVWVDGVIVFTVPSTPIPTAAAALNFMNVTLAGYFGMNATNGSPTLIDPTAHQEMVNIIETATGPACANTMVYSYINWDATGWGGTGWWDTFAGATSPTPATASGFGYRGP